MRNNCKQLKVVLCPKSFEFCSLFGGKPVIANHAPLLYTATLTYVVLLLWLQF